MYSRLCLPWVSISTPRAVTGEIWFYNSTLWWTRPPRCPALTSSRFSIALRVGLTLSSKDGRELLLLETLISFLRYTSTKSAMLLLHEQGVVSETYGTINFSVITGTQQYQRYNWTVRTVCSLPYVPFPTWCHIVIFTRVSCRPTESRWRTLHVARLLLR